MNSNTKKIILTLLLILAILGLILCLFFFVLFFLQNKTNLFLKDTISKEATLQYKNVDVWGNYTDSKNVKIINKLKFYDYKDINQEQLIVQETPHVQLREHHLVHDLNFHDKNQFVDYFREITRVPYENDNKFKAKFPNFLGIFFWNKIQNLPQEERTWMALSALMGKLIDNEFFKRQIQSQTLWDQLQFKNFSFVKFSIFTGLNLTNEQMNMLHGDNLYGLGNKHGIFKWIQFLDLENIENENLKIVQYELKNYFKVKLNQIVSIYQKIIPFIKELEIAFQTEFMCQKFCTSKEIFNKQWSQSQLSLKFLQKDSIADNKEIFGFLEYNKFYNEKYKSLPDFDVAYMDVEQADNLLAVDMDNFTSAKRWDTLIHKTNIKEFLEVGKVFDSTQNENVFQEIQQRFKLKNLKQAIVLYEYLKYMGDDFLKMNDQEGNMEITALTNVSAEYFQRFFEETVQFFRNAIFSKSFEGLMSEINIDCKIVLQASIPFIKAQKVEEICNEFKQQNLFANELYNTCQTGQKTNLKNLSKVQLYMLCEQESSNENSYYQLYQQFLKVMSQLYSIDILNISPEYFTICQFLNGSITQVTNKHTQNKYPVTDSIQNWLPNKFRNKIELKTFAINTKQEESFKEYNQTNFKKLMSINGLFNGIVVQRAVLTSLKKDFSYFKEHFELQNFDFFLSYLKYFLKEVVIGGDFININQGDGIDGIESPFLKEFAEKKVLKGGDPSIPYKFQILKPKEKANIQKNTGQLNFRLTDNYHMFQDKSFVPSQPQPYFNGNSTTELFLNPYEKEIPLRGFELQSNPYTKEDDLKDPKQIHISPSKDNFILYFIEAVGRIFKLNYQQQKDLGYHNYQGYEYKIDDSEFEANDYNKKIYNQNIPGFLNGTQVLGGPVYISRNRFLGVDETIVKNIQILNEDGKKVIADDKVDNIWMTSEKYTGCGVNINVNLQINMKIDDNILFEPLFQNYDTLYPLFNIHVTVDFEDEQYSKVLGDLRIPYKILNHYFLFVALGFIIFIILTCLCVFGAYKVNQIQSEDEKNDNLEVNEGLV